LEEVNIDSDLLLLDRYRYDIPVIAINGVDVFKHRVTVDQFVEALRTFSGLTKEESANST
jgi:hypothetical protein